MSITEKKQAHLVALDQIKPERSVPSTTAAREPGLIQWVQDQLGAGESFEVIRRKLGLGPASTDRRWRAIREEIAKVELPANEDDALASYYSQLEELEAERRRCQDDIQEILEKGVPTVDAKEYDKEGHVIRTYPVESKSHHFYLKMKQEGITQQIETLQKKYEGFLSAKRIKKQQKPSVKIVIVSKIPRPDRADVAKAVEEIDE